MGFVEKITKEIDSSWSLEEKIRFLYLKSCEVFSYDERYWWYTPAFFQDWEEKVERVINKKIVVETLDEKPQDDLVVCFSWSYLFQSLLKTVLNVDCEVIKGPAHASTVAKTGQTAIFADSCTRSMDLFRVKLNLSTYGYEEAMNKNFTEKLKSIDEKIGYSYYAKILNQLKGELESQKRGLDFDEQLITSINAVGSIQNALQLHHFGEAIYACNYLMQKLFRESEKERVRYNELANINHNEVQGLYGLYELELDFQYLYYLLSLENGFYQFREIKEDEAECLARNLAVRKLHNS